MYLAVTSSGSTGSKHNVYIHLISHNLLYLHVTIFLNFLFMFSLNVSVNNYTLVFIDVFNLFKAVTHLIKVLKSWPAMIIDKCILSFFVKVFFFRLFFANNLTKLQLTYYCLGFKTGIQESSVVDREEHPKSNK